MSAPLLLVACRASP